MARFIGPCAVQRGRPLDPVTPVFSTSPQRRSLCPSLSPTSDAYPCLLSLTVTLALWLQLRDRVTSSQFPPVGELPPSLPCPRIAYFSSMERSTHGPPQRATPDLQRWPAVRNVKLRACRLDSVEMSSRASQRLSLHIHGVLNFARPGRHHEGRFPSLDGCSSRGIV